MQAAAASYHQSRYTALSLSRTMQNFSRMQSWLAQRKWQLGRYCTSSRHPYDKSVATLRKPKATLRNAKQPYANVNSVSADLFICTYVCWSAAGSGSSSKHMQQCVSKRYRAKTNMRLAKVGACSSYACSSSWPEQMQQCVENDTLQKLIGDSPRCARPQLCRQQPADAHAYKHTNSGPGAVALGLLML